MAKYTPLTDFLAGQDLQEVPMSFAEIEHVIGTRLPPSKQHPAWWSNNPSNNVMTRAWLAAGFQTERVDTARERLVFRRAHRQPAVLTAAPAPGASKPTTPSGETFFEGIRARLGGTVHFIEGVDITEPTGEEWDAQR